MTLDAVDPATGHTFAEIPETSPAAVAELVADARRALAVEAEWRTPAVRAAALSRLAERIADEADALAELECRDAGTPLSRARADAGEAARRCVEEAGAIGRLGGRTAPRGPGVHAYTLREPWGVCGVLLSWRRPLHAAARRFAPALAAGNAVILKPSALASLPALRLADLAAEAGVPRGMLQVATGAGETGAALAAAADHVTFSGSAASAAAVAQPCARRLVPLELELSGGSAVVLFADADLDAAVPAVAGALGAGGTRLLVERPRFDEALARVAGALGSLTVGPGSADPQLGPLISQRALERAFDVLAGAEIVTGGEHTGGLFLTPALVRGAPPAELSAPVVWAQPFAGEREAIDLVREPVVGVWTHDLARAHRVAAAVRADHVSVNGLGHEGGDMLLAYTRVKTVSVVL